MMIKKQTDTIHLNTQRGGREGGEGGERGEGEFLSRNFTK